MKSVLPPVLVCAFKYTTIYAVIPIRLLRPQVMEWLNQDLVAIHSWYLKWHVMLNPKKTKSMLVSRPRTYASGNGDLILGGEELEEVKRVCVYWG